MDPRESELLGLLDQTPQSVDELARKTGRSEEAIEKELVQAETEGWAVNWGQRWATTWRAKLRLDRSFFARWIPWSFAASLVLTAVVVWVNGPSDVSGAVPWVLLGLGVVGFGWGAWAGRA